MVAVRLRHQQHERLGGLEAGTHQQLRDAVQVGRVGGSGVAQRGQLGLTAWVWVCEEGAGEAVASESGRRAPAIPGARTLSKITACISAVTLGRAKHAS